MKLKILITALLLTAMSHAEAQRILFTPQWTPQSQFAGYYVAQEMGFYEEAGVEVVIEHSSASDLAFNRLKRGQSNAITMHLFDAIYHIEKGHGLVNILQTAQRSGHVVVARHDKIKQLEDLRGCRVGIWRSSFGQLAQLMDLDHDLHIEWIPFVQSINLYISGAIDATMAMIYNEVFWILSSGFEDKKIIPLSELGYNYPEEGLYISRSYYERYPDKARAFAEASRRGWEWAHEHPEETLEIVLRVMQREGVPVSRLHQEWMLREVLKMQIPTGEKLPYFGLDAKQVDALNALLLKHNRISKPISVAQIQGR
ncbi:MAG: ABC transporter substrate-binding protein [Rikenellaceae bacterium]|nr:ABC transporter substrate-binding protein [Rikenellaceae bacterium]